MIKYLGGRLELDLTRIDFGCDLISAPVGKAFPAPLKQRDIYMYLQAS